MSLSLSKSNIRKLFSKKSFYVVLIVLITVACQIAEYGFKTPYESDFDSKGNLAVCFIDVGQSDCTLIKTPSGKHMLIDAGTSDAKYKIIDYLTNNNVSEIEYCVFTHPHEDHIGCGDAVLENFTVNNVIMTSKYETTAVFERLIDAIKASKSVNKTKVLLPSIGETYNIDDDVYFTILSADGENEDTNNSSIALKLTYGNTDFLFTGDAEKNIEYKMLESGADLSSEVFKSGHHGSSTSNSEEFLEAVSPDIVVFSCGQDNSYGHPHNEVVALVNEMGADIYRTDTDGDVVLFSDGNSVNLNMTHKAK